MSVETLRDAARKKQFGQYFTHQRVGTLLAALAGAESARTIIDPMVGSADLLRSCLSVGASPHKLVGVELDPIALDRARLELSRVPGSELILGDAFSIALPLEQFDLVITNPPYIRYQAKGMVGGLNVPTSKDVRAGLVRAIQRRAGLSRDEQDLWLRAAMSYPGTSDVAVPAWILSAALVRDGGVLAVVVPQAWLSRNYAHAVRELLDGAFDVEVIVEDGDAAWFDDAQVRTHLVVARRRPIGRGAVGHSIVMARATAGLDTKGKLRGSLRSETAVAAALRSVTSSQTVEVTDGLTAHVERDLSVAAVGGSASVPTRVAAILGLRLDDFSARTLESYGWRAGQGLRSGANDFFYVSVMNGDIRPAPRWGIQSLEIPPECLLPAIRRQSDLGADLRIGADLLTSRVLNLRGWATAADLKRMGPSPTAKALPTAMTRWINQVSKTPVSDKDPAKLFPGLTAVAPNVKTDRAGRAVGFWYQLPELAARHRPSLLIARVCGGRPTAYLNASGAVVDANFSSLWPCAPDAMPPEALLALLNSSWAWANLEENCTVLGGGALKVEAIDLRRLALPDLSAKHLDRLRQLGCALMGRRSSELVRAIDKVVVDAVTPGAAGKSRGGDLQAFAERRLKYRIRAR
ncbi:N-6 DNA methylase [Mycobacteroides abscessus]|uniref:N-6 DNA methylase n=1 Tax=Mycobacteroides abscessus TaxID=36809 RepID=UPI000C257C0A|nr:N-6 DNA methylase [Mycobacteroides abscessus]